MGYRTPYAEEDDGDILYNAALDKLRKNGEILLPGDLSLLMMCACKGYMNVEGVISDFYMSLNGNRYKNNQNEMDKNKEER